MSTINDGGPAFPVSTINEREGHQDGPNTWQFPGMTLRDYFAAKAMQGLLAQSCGTALGSDPIHGAQYAYQMADAMLVARGARRICGGLRDEQTPTGPTGGIEMTDQQRQEFEAVTRPVIEWLNANCHPHVTVVIEPTGAMLSEGIIAYTTNDYLRDKITEMEQQKPVAFGLYSGWALKATYLKEHEACEQRDRRQLTADLSGSREAYRVVPLYALPGAQNVPKAVAYLDLGTGGYMDIGTDLTDEALAALPKGRHMLGIVGTYGVDGYVPAQPAPSVPGEWLPVPEKHPTFDPVDLQLSDGSVLCGCAPQADGDYWWEGPSGEVFIDPKYANVTHWRLAAAPEAKP